MKFRNLVLLLLFATCPASPADGFIKLQNELSSEGESWRVLLDIAPGVTVPLSREDCRAQLYAGVSPDDLHAVGPIVGFGTEAKAGFFKAMELGDDLSRRVPTIDGVSGGMTWVQIRAWSFWPAISSFEDAMKRVRCDSFSPWGSSAVVQLKTSSIESDPAPMPRTSMLGFTVVIPPAVQVDQFYDIKRISGGVQYRYIANVGGFPGVHELERSADLTTWQRVQSFTNDFEVVVSITNMSGSGLYRMRRVCE